MFVKFGPKNFLKKCRPAAVLLATLLAAALALSACSPSGKSAGKAAGKPVAAMPRESGKSYKVRGRVYKLLATADGFADKGLATFYGKRFNGRRTASGEKFSMNAMTAAHPTLPFNTKLEVKNLANDRTVVVRVNDRGPFNGHRYIIDLSQGAARAIGLTSTGEVSIRAVGTDRDPEHLQGRRK